MGNTFYDAVNEVHEQASSTLIDTTSDTPSNCKRMIDTASTDASLNCVTSIDMRERMIEGPMIFLDKISLSHVLSQRTYETRSR